MLLPSAAGQAVKAMLLNGLRTLISLYLIKKCFEGKATEHLLGEGIQPTHLNGDRLGRALDKSDTVPEPPKSLSELP